MVAANGVTASFLSTRELPVHSARRPLTRNAGRASSISRASTARPCRRRPDARALERFCKTQRTAAPMISRTFARASSSCWAGASTWLRRRPDRRSDTSRWRLQLHAFDGAQPAFHRSGHAASLKAALETARPLIRCRSLRRWRTHCTKQEDAANKVERLVGKRRRRCGCRAGSVKCSTPW